MKDELGLDHFEGSVVAGVRPLAHATQFRLSAAVTSDEATNVLGTPASQADARYGS